MSAVERAPHGLMAIAGGAGLAATIMLITDRFAQLEGEIAGVESTFSCDVSAFVSCGGVMDSTQATVLGFENTIMGVVGFSVVLTVGIMSWAGASIPRLVLAGLQLGATCAIVFVTWLQFQSIYRLDLLCPYCMVVWAVTIPLFVYITAHTLRSFAPDAFLTRLATNWAALVVALWYVGIASAIWFHFGDRLFA